MLAPDNLHVRHLSKESSGFKESPPGSMKAEGHLVISLPTIYSAALLCAATFFLNLGFDDVRDDGSVSVMHWPVIARLFEVDHLVNLFALWVVCNACVFLASGGFFLWRSGRTALLKRNRVGAEALWNCSWTTAALLLHTAMLVFTSWAAYELELPASAVCALCFEQVRLLMKSYAYLREHVKAALAVRDSNDSPAHLAYFLFAPTLVYQDSYERTPRVRWHVVAVHAVLFLLTLFTMVVASSRGALRPFCGGADAALMDNLMGLGAAARLALRLALMTARTTPVGIVLAVGFTLSIHSWHVVFAELLRYPVRGFTQPWWNSSSYTGFFHDWNIFVKGWLLTYVFKELMVRGHSTIAAKLITIILSAVWHEYILAVSLGYVIPWCGVFYIVSSVIVLTDPLKLQKDIQGNIFVLISLSVGIATFMAFYFLESTARIQCDPTLELPWDLFVPRSLTCDQPFANCTTF